jgi:hypothetical protein
MSKNDEPKEAGKKTPSLFAKINEDTGKMLIESLLPKILPFVESAEEKLNEFLGENEKTIIMFRMKGKTKVLILNNSSGEYSIANSAIDKSKNEFMVDEDAIEKVLDVKELAQQLLTGNFNL